MSSTYRRIGDEIYRSFKAIDKVRKNDEMTRAYPAIFLESEDAQIRFLSCLIILRTLKQSKLKKLFIYNFYFLIYTKSIKKLIS